MGRIVKSVEYEIEKIKNSRFIGYGFPLIGSSSIDEKITIVRHRHPKAGHFCFAWRRSNGEEGSSDDGEPRGSAGAPILQRLTGFDLVDTLIVVVRYFGGTKLGVGGLVRAYGQTARSTIERAEIEEVVIKQSLSFQYSYDLETKIMGVLRCYSDLLPQFKYSEIVSVWVEVPIEQVEELKKKIQEESSGRVIWFLD
jgi:uncharacterized YigZ family protein